VLLDRQDRSLWNREQIQSLVQRGLCSRRIGPYALQAVAMRDGPAAGLAQVAGVRGAGAGTALFLRHRLTELAP
jgi:hypothetical protein